MFGDFLIAIKNSIKEITKEQWYSWLIGFGMIIMVIHNPNQPLAQTRVLFLPILGLVTILFCSFDYLLELRHKGKVELGSKWIWIPLLVIVASIILRPIYTLITGDGVVIDIIDKGLAFEIVNAAIATGLFSLYVVSRKLGSEVFKPFFAGVIIASASMVYGYFVTGGKNGGIISPGNYDIATGFLVFGFLVSSLQHRWWLSSIAIIGLFFTGADEAIFVCVTVAIVILARRDWSRKILLPVASLIVLLVICTPLGITHTLYSPTEQKIAAAKEVIEDTPIGHIAGKIIPDAITNQIEKAKPDITQYNNTTEENAYWNEATGKRWLGYWQLSSIKPLGYGYNINQFYRGIPHNTPMIIIEQIGIVGAIAWCIVVGYCLIKTKWKYAWVGFIALGVFDHFTWTMAAPWFWALAGVSSTSVISKDYIFKGEKQ